MSLNTPELSQHASLKPQHPSEYILGQYDRLEAASIIKRDDCGCKAISVTTGYVHTGHLSSFCLGYSGNDKIQSTQHPVNIRKRNSKKWWQLSEKNLDGIFF